MTDERLDRTEHWQQGADERFDRIDAWQRQADERFSRIDQRFDRIDQRFTEVDQRFDRVDQRFDRLESRVDRIDERLDILNHRVGVLHEDTLSRIAAIDASDLPTKREMAQGFADLRELIERRHDPLELAVRQHTKEIERLKRRR